MYFYSNTMLHAIIMYMTYTYSNHALFRLADNNNNNNLVLIVSISASVSALMFVGISALCFWCNKFVLCCLTIVY